MTELIPVTISCETFDPIDPTLKLELYYASLKIHVNISVIRHSKCVEYVDWQANQCQKSQVLKLISHHILSTY